MINLNFLVLSIKLNLYLFIKNECFFIVVFIPIKYNHVMSNSVKAERMKSDLKQGLAQVFLRKGLTNVMFSDVYISNDFKFAKVEIDTINTPLDEMVTKLNEKRLHSEIVRDLHKYTKINNFPRLVFIKDSHKLRIEKTQALFDKIHEKNNEADSKIKE